MRAWITMIVLGMTVGCLITDATAQNRSSRRSESSAKIDAVLDKGGSNSIEQQVASKARAPALRHDADPSVDLASLKAAVVELKSKFAASSKVNAKTGAAATAAEARGDGGNAKTASAVASKAYMGAARAISRSEHQPDAVNKIDGAR